MAKVIIVISGKKGSGKDTFANMLSAQLLNITQPLTKSHWVDEKGHLYVREIPSRNKYPLELRHLVGSEAAIVHADIRVLSFATPLKQFAMDVLGLPMQSCYGSNEEKEIPTHILWDGLPFWVRWKYRKHWWTGRRSGPMTGREVLQIFGTEIIREWFADAWAVAAYKFALSTSESYVIIPDCRFPNEVERKDVISQNAYVVQIRAMRAPHKDNHPSEISLDSYPTRRFDVVLPGDITLSDMWEWAEAIAIDVHSAVELWNGKPGLGIKLNLEKK